MAQVVNEPDLAATYGIQPYMFEPDSEPELETEDIEKDVYINMSLNGKDNHFD